MKNKRLRTFPISRLFPNMVTIGGLCCGASAIRFAMDEKWEAAVIFIIVAAVLDGMDGMIARMLKATSDFGAQLDSLTDIISFGIAPALVMYMWMLSDLKRFGWAVVLFYIVCCALRLARFNAMQGIEDSETTPKAHRRYFTGLPSPGGAMVTLSPLMLTFHGIDLFQGNDIIAAIYLGLVGLLMVSRLPAYAAKNIHINQPMVLPIMIGTGAVFVFIIIAPWLTLPILSALYLCSIPFSCWQFAKHKNALGAGK